MNWRTLIALFFLLIPVLNINACQCQNTMLSTAECDKYEIIFRGRITEVKDCDARPGEAVFEILELYKGVIGASFTIVFDCKDECAQKMLKGQEWIIYSHYKQVTNGTMEWCSRSRQLFHSDKEDFYTVTSGNDYESELKFLRNSLGIHRVASVENVDLKEMNQHPDMKQTIIYLCISLAGMVAFYWLFKKVIR